MKEGQPAAGLAALGLLLGGCSELGYYAHAVSGHASLLAARQPLASVVADPQSPERLRARLTYASTVREFAVASLGLPDNGSYRTFADLGRRYVAWAVVATPELSLVPQTWCFPVAGCVAYRGYFSTTPGSSRSRPTTSSLRGSGGSWTGTAATCRRSTGRWST